MRANAYGVIVLAGLLSVYGVNLVAEVLNLRALGTVAPPGFADVYPSDTYRRSQEYARARTRLGFAASGVDTGVLLAFWLLGGFSRLDSWLRGFDLGAIWTGMLYLGILAVAQAFLNFPFRLYVTFVLEQRFGFNRTTPAVMAADVAKGVGLALVLGLPLMLAFLAVFEYAGSLAWVYVWVGVALLMVILEYLVPRLVLPLYFRFSPLEDGELSEAIFSYARSVGFPLKAVYVIDASRRSTKGNAFFTGFGKNKRIALFDTLLGRYSSEELVAIIAHEIGHYRKGHVLRGASLQILWLGGVLALFSVLLEQPGFFAAFGVEAMSVYVGIAAFSVLYRPADFLFEILQLYVSRRHEEQADRFAARSSGLTHALVSGLKKLSADSLSNLTPHPLYVFLNYSHPPLVKRIARVQGERVVSGPATGVTI